MRYTLGYGAGIRNEQINDYADYYQNMVELVVLRNVVEHKLGMADKTAIAKCSWRFFNEGTYIRFDNRDLSLYIDSSMRFLNALKETFMSKVAEEQVPREKMPRTMMYKPLFTLSPELEHISAKEAFGRDDLINGPRTILATNHSRSKVYVPLKF